MMYHSALDLVTALRGRGHVISDKSVIVSTEPQLGNKLARLLSNRGVPVKLARSTKDLGVDVSQGHVRRTATVRKRVLKGRNRAKKVGYWHGLHDST